MQNRYRSCIFRFISVRYNIGIKSIRIITILVLFLAPGVATAFERYNNMVKYDKYFSKYSKRYFGPAFDWHYFKAQAIAESRLKATAKSKVGALGVMQIMPKTFEEIARKNPTVKGSREQPQ